jgi:putative transposase
MVKTEMYPIKRLMSVEELDKRIKSLEKDVKVLKRLYFVKNRYQGDSVEVASGKVGITKMVGYEWQNRWNKEGYAGLIPRYAGGRPSKLTENQKEELKAFLKEREDWTTDEIKKLIKKRYGVEYTLKQIRVIVRKFGMKCGKPYPKDYRRPDNAAEILKKP